MILDLSAEQYHADKVVDVPTLSRSIAHLLCTASPAHARAAHPRLNPFFARKDDPKFDLGTATHDVFFAGPERLVIVDAENWRTNAAKAERYEARVQGKIALLAHEHGRVLEMVDALVRGLDEHGANPRPFDSKGKAEQTLTWEEAGGVVCRARLDWLHDDYTYIDDLKTTGHEMGASPEKFTGRSFYGNGYDLQAAFYTRGVLALTGALPTFRFVVIETEPPYALSVVTPGPDVLTLANKKVEWALDLWRRCLASGDWPSYDRRVATAVLPVWEEARWLEKEGALAA